MVQRTAQLTKVCNKIMTATDSGSNVVKVCTAVLREAWAKVDALLAKTLDILHQVRPCDWLTMACCCQLLTS